MGVISVWSKLGVVRALVTALVVGAGLIGAGTAAGAQSRTPVIDIGDYIDGGGGIDLTGYLEASGSLTTALEAGCDPLESAETAGLATITPGEVTPGGSVSISGSGFEPSSTVTITIDGPGGVVTLGTVQTDSSGSFSTTVQIPDGTAGGAYCIVGSDGSRAVFGTIEVMGASQGAGTLPVTGEDTGLLVSTAAVLIVVGAGVVYAVRQRRVLPVAD